MNRSSVARRQFLRSGTLGMMALSSMSIRCGQAQRGKRLPNFIIMFTDDQGYADVGCYGAKDFHTPNLDQMAREGLRFTDFYVAAPVCSPSRAALMTGCYPQRVGLPHVLAPEAPSIGWITEEKSKTGLHPKETTVAEMLKTKGYRTACFGKWHLGHHPEHLPTRHGFDAYFGLPYSNDMRKEPHKDYPPLPVLDGEKVVMEDPDQSHLTTWYTERAVQFIHENKDQPFFLYVPHSMPHVPLYVSDKFKGNTDQGLYGDVIAEIDWSMGEIIKTIKELGLDQDTFVMFSSDNGPWLTYGNHAGSAEPLREGKMTTFEGGQRVPCIMRWPGKIPAGQVCEELATTMDILPTLAHLADCPLPTLEIDGKNIWPLVSGQPDARTPHEAIYFYRGRNLEAVRSIKWKLHLPHDYTTVVTPGQDGDRGESEQAHIELALFDLENDVSEQHNVAEKHPEVVRRLMQYAEMAKKELGHGDQKGTGQREPGWAGKK